MKSIVTNKAHDEDMVQRLLIFKKFADNLVNDTFATPVPTTTTKNETSTDNKDEDSKMHVDSDSTLTPKQPPQLFLYALSDSFRRGFKYRRNIPAEMLAKHVDKAMRKGQQGRKDEDFAGELDKVLGLYRFTEDKDVFRAFYHKALAKRLLLEKSASDDFEKAMLKKLKEGAFCFHSREYSPFNKYNTQTTTRSSAWAITCLTTSPSHGIVCGSSTLTEPDRATTRRRRNSPSWSSNAVSGRSPPRRATRTCLSM